MALDILLFFLEQHTKYYDIIAKMMIVLLFRKLLYNVCRMPTCKYTRQDSRTILRQTLNLKP